MSEDAFYIWTVALPAAGLAFAAFCVWLTVRIVNRRERWAIWTAAGLVVVLLSLAGFAAMMWLDFLGLPKMEKLR
jgi:hypothetical protein